MSDTKSIFQRGIRCFRGMQGSRRSTGIRCLFRRRVVRFLTAVPGLTLLLCAGTPALQTDPVPGGNVDPTKIPKYVIPLVIPPVMKKLP